VEHDCSEVFVSATCIPEEVCTPLHTGETCPTHGGLGAVPSKLKTDVKMPCKSIVISSQSGPFIRRMI
jgi:hypothetical protein